MPAAWDFPHVDQRPDDFHLPEVQVGTWAGFVFINPDPDAEPLADFLGGFPEHMAIWDLEHRYVEAHIRKVIRANWKITQEAFCEAYHVGATHPQILPYLGDTNSQVDVWDHVLAGDHPRRHAEPAAQLGADRGGDAPLDARRARRPGHADPAVRRADRPGRRRRGVA